MKQLNKLLLFFIIFCYSMQVNALEFPKTYSSYMLLYDNTEENLIYEQESEKKVSIASLTKVMTVINAIEKIKDFDETITITYNMLKDVSPVASVAGLKVGDQVTYLDLLYAIMLPSGADAAQVIALSLNGSVESFVEDMNSLARTIGMKNTHFMNVTGLDQENHYSTASDLLLLMKYALKNETFRTVFKARTYELPNGLTLKSTVEKYNKNMHLDTSKITGSKTGFTYDAGLCIMTTFETNEHEMILILLNAPYGGMYYNLIDATTMIDFMDENYQKQVIVKKGQKIKTLNVSLSTIEKYDIIVPENIEKYLPIDYKKEDVNVVYDGTEELSYKNKKGEKLGTITYQYQGETIKTDVVTLETEIKLDILKVIQKYWIFIVCTILALLLFIIILKKKKLSRRKK